MSRVLFTVPVEPKLEVAFDVREGIERIVVITGYDVVSVESRGGFNPATFELCHKLSEEGPYVVAVKKWRVATLEDVELRNK